MSELDSLESILVVFQNHVEGRRDAYDDWYTNIHIRDAMRLDGAIATQRFIVANDQLVLGGRRVEPDYWAHTLYEWESAAKSVKGHIDRAGTPAMEISSDGAFTSLRDYFYRPAFMSHGWTRAEGYRRGTDVLTVMIKPKDGGHADLVEWFGRHHAPATLALPGFASAGFFTLHEEQSLPQPSRFAMVAIYGLSDATRALRAWSERHDARSDLDPSFHVREAEATCWQPRTARLRAEDVAHPTPAAAAEEQRARALLRDRFLTQEQLVRLLAEG